MAFKTTRRTFLARAAFCLSGFVCAVLGGSGGWFILSPAWKSKKEGWIPVCRINELAEGVPGKVGYIKRQSDGWMVVEGRSAVWLLREKDSVTAFNPQCTHLGCPYRWDQKKNAFLCPCHTAMFSKMGEVISGPPPRPLDRFPAKVENGVVMILPASRKGGYA